MAGTRAGRTALLGQGAMEGHHHKGCPSNALQSPEGSVQEEWCCQVSTPGSGGDEAARARSSVLPQPKASSLDGKSWLPHPRWDGLGEEQCCWALSRGAG